MAVPSFRFTEPRRQDLARSGITEAQITELERVLPECRLLIDNSSPLTNVRDQLEDLIAALDRIRRLLEARAPEAREARERWRAEYYNLNGHLLDDKILRQLSDAARDAKAGLGSEQRRGRAANPQPIRLIADALVLGWAKAHAGGILPRMPANHTSPRGLREIAQIAYEAIGAKRDLVPERAIRAYCKWRKREASQRTADRERMVAIEQEPKTE